MYKRKYAHVICIHVYVICFYTCKNKYIQIYIEVVHIHRHTHMYVIYIDTHMCT